MRDCAWVTGVFENIDKSGFDPIVDCTSDRTRGQRYPYNCIAWAAGRNNQWWWPSNKGGYTWPTQLLKEREGEETIQNFIMAFELEGYAKCTNASFEHGYEKVAIFADSNRVPTHAARSLESGSWTSKLGNEEDIQHVTLDAISGIEYGTPVAFLRRRNPLWPKPHPLTTFLSFLSGSFRKLFKRS